MKDKIVVVGITGGIAAYKACELVSSLKKQGAIVHVIMTKNAVEFVSPLTLKSLSGNPVTVDMFEKDEGYIKHISLAKCCDIAVIAPCTANVIGKIAAGICDDFLTTFVMATKAKVVIAPAMNTNMIESTAYQENFATLIRRGFLFVDADSGLLACGDTGKGRLASIDKILDFVKNTLNQQQLQKNQEKSAQKNQENLLLDQEKSAQKNQENLLLGQEKSAQKNQENLLLDQEKMSLKRDFVGKKVLVTAGGTVCQIDPVRYIGNYSSGKMGVEIARAAAQRGAEVTLILGKSTIDIGFECNLIRALTTTDMYNAVMTNVENSDYIIKAAAPCDYEVQNKAENKIKNSQLTLSLTKSVDIAKEVGKVKNNKKLVIFAAESENLLENASKKLKNKNADMVVANDITKTGAGFDVDTNIVTLIFRNGKKLELEKTSKQNLAHIILDQMNQL